MTDKTVARVVGRLTALAILVTAVSTISYGLGVHMVVRYFEPRAGAWWNAHEFVFAQTAATALGLLIGIRIGARFIDDARARRRSLATALIIAALALVLATPLCGTIARFGWSGHSGAVRDRLVGAAGYDVAGFLLKLVFALVYALKIVVLALMLGLVVVGLAMLATSFAERAPAAEKLP
ncbi:MAG TPA: hypothetical protein VIX59_12010 [Candidatus Binataceae bacterium]